MAKAKTRAKEGLVERIVIGPKPIYCRDPKTGDRIVAQIGDTVYLPPHTAKTFARYLQSPEVAAAEAAVAAAEAEAAEDPGVTEAKATEAKAKADAAAEVTPEAEAEVSADDTVAEGDSTES